MIANRNLAPEARHDICLLIDQSRHVPAAPARAKKSAAMEVHIGQAAEVVEGEKATQSLRANLSDAQSSGWLPRAGDWRPRIWSGGKGQAYLPRPRLPLWPAEGAAAYGPEACLPAEAATGRTIDAEGGSDRCVERGGEPTVDGRSVPWYVPESEGATDGALGRSPHTAAEGT